MSFPGGLLIRPVRAGAAADRHVAPHRSTARFTAWSFYGRGRSDGKNGVPIDVETLEQRRAHWSDIQDQLIAEVDRDYGVYEGRTFKADRFAELLGRNNIPWPMLDSGRLDLSDDTFRQMARTYPIVRRYVNCATRFLRCGFPISEWVKMAAIA